MVATAGTLEIQLIADIARLQKDMREMQRVVGAANDNIERSSSRAGGAFGGMTKSMQANTVVLARNFSDVAQGIALGQKPMTIFLQQGFQISEVLALMAAEARRNNTSLLAMAGQGLGKVKAGGAAAAVGIGVLLGVLGDFKDSIEEAADTKEFVASLGLTKKELKKLGDATVSWGDMMLGIWDVVAKGFTDTFGTQIDAVAGFFSDIWDFIVSDLKMEMNGLIGIFVGAYNGIVGVWGLLPGAIGDAFYSAVNLAIKAINALLKTATDQVNAFIGLVNQIPGMDLGTLTAPQFDEIENAFAGKGADAGAAFAKGFRDANARDFMGEFGSAATDATIARRNKRVGQDAQDLIDKRRDGGSRAKKLSDEEKAALAALKASKEYAEGLEKETAQIGLNSIQLKELEANKAATAAVDAAFKATNEKVKAELFEQSKAITDNLAKWKARKAEFAGTEFDRMIKQLQGENTLLGLIGPARDKAAIALEKDAKMIEWAADGLTDLETRWAQYLKVRTEGVDAATAAEANKAISDLEFENRLIGETIAQQELLRGEREATLMGLERGSEAWNRYVAAIQAAIDKQNELAAQEAILDGLDEAAGRVSRAAQSMSSAFGEFGDTIGRVSEIFADYAAEKARAQDRMAKAERDYGKQSQQYANAQNEAKSLELDHYSQLAGAAKKFFKEGSAGYKAMEAAEKAFALVQLANTAKNVAAGAAKMFAALGPWAFPVVAAMIGVMAALGFSGGGRASVSGMTAEDVQAAQGAGSVLGDPTGKSDSIRRALELTAENTNRMLEYDNAMLRALRSIETNIGALATSIAKEFSVSGAFDQNKMVAGGSTKGLFDYVPMLVGGLAGFLVSKLPVVGDIIGAIGKLIFNVKKTVTIVDQGVQFASTTLGAALAGGISGQTYDMLEIKKKKSLFGIGISSSTSYETQTKALDADVARQVGLVLASLRDSVVSAASILGMDVADALDTFKVEIGKISFKDMKPDEIAAALEAVFSKVGDQMAGFAVAGLEQFQRAGEGLFETLVRLAKDYQTIDVSLASIGKTFGAVGAASIGARESLIALFGSLEGFVEDTAFYQQNFLTPEQQIAPIRAQVQSTLAALGLSSVDTIDAFRNVVDGIDLTTEAGQNLFATLMRLAPAFFAVEQAEEQAAQKIADISRQRASMEIQLLEAQGRASEALAAKRQLELAALDESLRPLQMAIYAEQDLAAVRAAAEQDIAAKRNVLSQAYERESSALEATANKFRELAQSLRQFRATLFADGNDAASYAAAAARLKSTASMAALGNESSLQALPGDAKAFLDASRSRAVTAVDYRRDVARVANMVDKAIGGAEGMASAADQSLAALRRSVEELIDINETTITVEQAVTDLRKALEPATVSIAERQQEANEQAEDFHRDLLTESERAREEAAAATATANATLGRMEKLLDRFETEGVQIRNVDGEIIKVEPVT